MTRLIGPVCIAIGAFHLSMAQAATLEIDPAAVLNERLASKGAFNKERWVPYTELVCRLTPCGGRMCEIGGDYVCERVQKQRREAYAGALTVTSTEPVRVSDLVLDRAQLRELPVRVEGQGAEIHNCVSTEISQTFSLSRTLTVGSSATKQVSLTRTRRIDARVTANVKDPTGAIGGSNSIGISVDRSVTLSDSATETISTTVTRAQTTVIRARPGGYVTRADLIVYDAAVEVPFTATVVFDGLLEANLDGKTRVSDLLTEADRTITVRGTITANNVSDAIIRQHERKATATECPETATERYAVQQFDWSSALPEHTSLAQPDARAAAAASRPSGETAPKAIQSLLGTPGAFCYLGPCNMPLDGTRPTCYNDETGACLDCWDEPDSVCQPPPDVPGAPE